MIHLLIVLSFCILSFGVIAAPQSGPQSPALAAEPGKGAGEAESQSLFRYKSGLLIGDAKREKLGTVLSALGKATKLKAVLRYKPEADETVSFRVKDKVLAEALKEVLRGYNYIYIPAAADSGELSKLILLGKVAAEVSEPVLQQVSILEQEEEQSTNSEEVKKKKLAGPWGLNEFRRLKEFCKPTAEANEYEYGKPKKEELTEECRDREMLEREDKLARALAALDTDYRNLKEAALDELKGINDPEATNALLNMALNSSDKELQQFAADALWQHAADLGFKDADANQALEVLAKKGDSTVKETGQRALEDAKRYAQQRTKEGYGG